MVLTPHCSSRPISHAGDAMVKRSVRSSYFTRCAVNMKAEGGADRVTGIARVFQITGFWIILAFFTLTVAWLPTVIFSASLFVGRIIVFVGWVSPPCETPLIYHHYGWTMELGCFWCRVRFFQTIKKYFCMFCTRQKSGSLCASPLYFPCSFHGTRLKLERSIPWVIHFSEEHREKAAKPSMREGKSGRPTNCLPDDYYLRLACMI